jgi:hypothetical protein
MATNWLLENKTFDQQKSHEKKILHGIHSHTAVGYPLGRQRTGKPDHSYIANIHFFTPKSTCPWQFNCILTEWRPAQLLVSG